jgi:hypothetical protein
MKREQMSSRPEEPLFVAFAYPGWHSSAYRPGVVEWNLLENFQPYFPGHCPPPMPAHGQYDDADPATASRHVRLASQAGIRAFMYFLYYGPDGFVMDEPMKLTLDASAQLESDVSIAGTWCVRLPHNQFPVAPRDELDIPAAPATPREIDMEDKPIESLTLRDLETLLGDDDSWKDILLTYEVAQPRRRPVGPDATDG